MFRHKLLNTSPLLPLSVLALAMLAGCGPSGEQTAAAPPPATSQTAAGTASIPVVINAARVTDERLANAANEPSQWMMVGGTHEETHYSTLDEVNTGHVDRI